MKCTNCGTEFNQGSFCPECGTRVTVSDASDSNPQSLVSDSQFTKPSQQSEKKPANAKAASNGVISLIFGLVAVITSGALIFPEIFGFVFAKKAKENGKMNKTGKVGFVCSIISIILCIVVIMGLIVFTVISGDKNSLSLLQEQSLKEYGNDVTIGEAVTALFEQPSWGTGDGTTEEDGTRKLVLHGTDRNDNQWIIAFLINDKTPENWQFTITQFNDEYNVDLYGSDLLMRYFACGEEKYFYAFNNIYCCGDKDDRILNASVVWDDMIMKSETEDENIVLSLSDRAGDFIKMHNELFPCEKSLLPGELFDNSLTYKAVKKNVNKYSDKLMLFEYLYAVDVFEFDVGNGTYATMVYAMDNEMNVHFIVYMDEIELYEEDDFAALVVPIGSQFSVNDDGTNITIIYYAAVSISDDAESIKSRIATPEERYEYALSYLADGRDVQQKRNDEANDEVNTSLTGDDYRNAIFDYLAGGGTYFYDWGLELEIVDTNDDTITWSWAAGGGYGKLIQSKNNPKDIQESDDVVYDDMYSYQYNGSSLGDSVDLEGTYYAEMARCIITMYDTPSESGACGYVDFAGFQFYAQGELYPTQYEYEYYVITSLNETLEICFDNNGESFRLAGNEYLMDSQIHYTKENVS